MQKISNNKKDNRKLSMVQAKSEKNKKYNFIMMIHICESNFFLAIFDAVRMPTFCLFK